MRPDRCTRTANSQTGQGIDSSAQWDVENRLVASQVVNSRDSLSYVYDPWGRRVWKLDYTVVRGTTNIRSLLLLA